MNSKSGKIYGSDIRDVDLVHYLEHLGFYPAKLSRNGIDFYYLSPLREEHNPSFHVNRKLNSWYDHGLGRGGSLVDFGMLFYKCQYREFLVRCAEDFSLKMQIAPVELSPGIRAESEGKIIVLADRPISTYGLVSYLHDRGIPKSVADAYCREVSYEIAGRCYYGIGFKNESGGFEIRNKNYKLSSSPKDITVIRNGAKEVQVFEGFFDLLSFKTMQQGKAESKSDYVVLNGAALFERARPVLEQYERIGLWLDRDTTGLAYTKYAMSLTEKYEDKSGLYQQYVDLNDWLNKKPMVSSQQLTHQNRVKLGI